MSIYVFIHLSTIVDELGISSLLLGLPSRYAPSRSVTFGNRFGMPRFGKPCLGSLLSLDMASAVSVCPVSVSPIWKLFQ
jgi:hypothetical protein